MRIHRELLRLLLAGATAGLLVSCAGSRSMPAGGAWWPYSGFTRYDGLSLSIFRDQFFSGTGLVIDPAGRRLLAAGLRPGTVTAVSLPEGTIREVFDFGEGSRFEQMLYRPDGERLFGLASTVQSDNLGRVPLARALLEIDFGLSMTQNPIRLRPGGWSHGLALEEDRGWLYTLDTAGPDQYHGAVLSRIDLYNQEMSLRRPVGGLPVGLREHAIVFDDRLNRIYALLSDGEPASDFDPPAEPGVAAGRYLATIEPDSFRVVDRVPLRDDLTYLGLVASPRGVVVVGTSLDPAIAGTWLTEIDPQLQREVSWFDFPDPVVDVESAAGRIFMPGRRGIYVVNLDFLSVEQYVPVPFDRPFDLAVAPDGTLACLTVDDPDWPGRPALALVDMAAGRVSRVIR